MYEDMLPSYLAMGISKDEFFHSTPYELEAYEEAYQIKREIADEQAWLQARYNLEAYMVALSHFGAGLSGKRSTAEFMKEPLMQAYKKMNADDNSNEELAVFEMKQRIHMLEMQGLPASPM